MKLLPDFSSSSFFHFNFACSKFTSKQYLTFHHSTYTTLHHSSIWSRCSIILTEKKKKNMSAICLRLNWREKSMMNKCIFQHFNYNFFLVSFLYAKCLFKSFKSFQHLHLPSSSSSSLIHSFIFFIMFFIFYFFVNRKSKTKAKLCCRIRTVKKLRKKRKKIHTQKRKKWKMWKIRKKKIVKILKFWEDWVEIYGHLLMVFYFCLRSFFIL